MRFTAVTVTAFFSLLHIVKDMHFHVKHKKFESGAGYLPAVIMDNPAEILYDGMGLNERRTEQIRMLFLTVKPKAELLWLF